MPLIHPWLEALHISNNYGHAVIYAVNTAVARSINAEGIHFISSFIVYVAITQPTH